MNRLGLFLVVFASGVAAQKGSEPKFEVVSIRPVPPNAGPAVIAADFTPFLPGGQFVDSRTQLHWMIRFAYDVKNYWEIVGLPKWAEDQSYAVAAKAGTDFPTLPAAENRRQVRLMLRAMLEDRFRLRVHPENRQETVYRMEVAKGGIKVAEVDPPVPPAKEQPVGAAMGNTSGRMIGKKSTMTSLAGALAIFLKRPVIDKTGLTGHYDFDVKWNSPDAGEASPGFGPEGLGLLISALRNQLGLRLSKATGSATYWVIDHVEPPTEN